MSSLLHLAASLLDLARRAVWFVVPVPLVAGILLAVHAWQALVAGGAP